jgi:hypothetical protein
VENISRRYSETATSIASYEIQEERLLEMMKDAHRVSDMLEIEARLSEVQNSLKQYRNSLASMDTDVAYSTVSIYLKEVGIYSQPEATTFGEKISDAFAGAIEGFRTDLQALAIWLVGNFLNILVFIVLLCVVILIIRRLVRRASKAKITLGKEKKDHTPEKKGQEK